MPFNLQVPDRVPELTMQGMQMFGAGLNEAGDAIGRVLEKNKERAREKKAYEVIGEQLGMDKNLATTLGVDELKGWVQGKQLKSAMDHVQAQMANETQRVNNEGSHIQALIDQMGFKQAQELSSDKGFGSALQGFSNPPGAMTQGMLPSYLQKPFTGEERLTSALNAGGQNLDEKGVHALASLYHYYSQNGGTPNPVFTDIPNTNSVLAQAGRVAYPVSKMIPGEVPTQVTPSGTELFYNGKTWTRNPPERDMTATDQHSYMATMLEGAKTLSTIHNNLMDARMNIANATKRKIKPDFTAADVKDLEEQHGRVKRALDYLGQPGMMPSVRPSKTLGPVRDNRSFQTREQNGNLFKVFSDGSYEFIGPAGE